MQHSGEVLRQYSELPSRKSNISLTLTEMFSSIDSLRKLHRKATDVDASFDARFEPINTRVAWDRVRDNLENGTHLHILDRVLELISITEASNQQAFVDILDNDVIEPLKLLKVGQAWLRQAYLLI